MLKQGLAHGNGDGTKKCNDDSLGWTGHTLLFVNLPIRFLYRRTHPADDQASDRSGTPQEDGVRFNASGMVGGARDPSGVFDHRVVELAQLGEKLQGLKLVALQEEDGGDDGIVRVRLRTWVPAIRHACFRSCALLQREAVRFASKDWSVDSTRLQCASIHLMQLIAPFSRHHHRCRAGDRASGTGSARAATHDCGHGCWDFHQEWPNGQF